MRLAPLLVLLAACGPKTLPVPKEQVTKPVGYVQTQPSPDAGAPPDAAPATPIADAYRDTAAKIVAAATADDAAWQRLRELTDGVGNRLSGTKALDQAIAWATKSLTADGEDDVHTEKVMVPHWVRGAESAKIVAPIDRDLVIIGLGGTVGTPKKGITAPVVVVTSWDDLGAKADQLKGKIVLYDVPMPAFTEEGGTHYGDIVQYRWAGATQAAAHGAVAVLMRSVTARSLRTPHTGSMGYDDKVTKTKIPAAAVTVEDAELIHRLVDSGKEVKVTLKLGAKSLPDVESANVIAELKGSTNPDEVVVIGAHLDSWDVGQGAQDDGSGVASVMQALKVLRDLGLQPKRTIRVVLFTNEENGTRGAKGYVADHADELANHVLALEMDSGGFTPTGFDVADGLDEEARKQPGAGDRLARMRARVLDLLSLFPGTKVGDGIQGAGADVDGMSQQGVPALGLDVEDSTYFDYHHTQADTLDKVDAGELAQDVAVIAVTAYVVADMPDRLDAE
jgi:carboxypeptidase Q